MSTSESPHRDESSPAERNFQPPNADPSHEAGQPEIGEKYDLYGQYYDQPIEPGDQPESQSDDPLGAPTQSDPAIEPSTKTPETTSDHEPSGTAPADPHSTPFYQRPLKWAAAVLAIGGAIGVTFFLGVGEPSDPIASGSTTTEPDSAAEPDTAAEPDSSSGVGPDLNVTTDGVPSSDPTVEPVNDEPLEYRGVTYSVESSLYETRDKFDRDDIVCVDVAIENNSHAPITVWNHEIAIIGPDGSHRNWDTFGTDTSLPSRDELKVGDSLAGALCFTPKTGTPQQSDYQLQFVPYTSQPLAIWTLPL